MVTITRVPDEGVCTICKTLHKKLGQITYQQASYRPQTRLGAMCPDCLGRLADKLVTFINQG